MDDYVKVGYANFFGYLMVRISNATELSILIGYDSKLVLGVAQLVRSFPTLYKYFSSDCIHGGSTTIRSKDIFFMVIPWLHNGNRPKLLISKIKSF